MEQILSIQSAVALGAVGNRVAAPVITRLGHRPILVDTMVLAAHPGYGLVAGGPAHADHFHAILKAVAHLGALPDIKGVVTGYLGAPEQVPRIASLISQWRAERADGVYVLDPVLGDNGRLYVERDIIEAMRSHLLPQARFLTPNQFELGVLSGRTITNAADADAAAEMLLNQNPGLQAVLVTGVGDDDGKIYDRLIGADTRHALAYAKRARGVPGGGDLLTAIFTSWIASGASLITSFTAASHDAHKIIDVSSDQLEIALFDHLHALTPISSG
jgi:pyridoxine kinase